MLAVGLTDQQISTDDGVHKMSSRTSFVVEFMTSVFPSEFAIISAQRLCVQVVCAIKAKNSYKGEQNIYLLIVKNTLVSRVKKYFRPDFCNLF